MWKILFSFYNRPFLKLSRLLGAPALWCPMFSYWMGTYVLGWMKVIRETDGGYSLFPRVFPSILIYLCCRENPGRTWYPRVLSLPCCLETGPFERRSHKRKGQVKMHWSRSRKQQKSCMLCIYIKLCICWKQFSHSFFPCSFSLKLIALPSCLYLSLHLPRPPLLLLFMFILPTFLVI